MTRKVLTIHMDVEIFDRDLLMKVATAHANRTERDEGLVEVVVDEADALIVLLDPGGGGDAYAGNMNEAGIQIIVSRVD